VPRWPWFRAVVAGSSMEPALRDGERVLVRRGTRAPVGAIVVVERPDRPGLLVVKRLTRIEPDGSWWVEGDNQRGSHDSWTFGPVPVDHAKGRVVRRG
jgi:nickel-type superoxide dismutase maturation protease